MGATDQDMSNLAQAMSHNKKTQEAYYDCRSRDALSSTVSKGIRTRLGFNDSKVCNLLQMLITCHMIIAY